MFWASKVPKRRLSHIHLFAYDAVVKERVDLSWLDHLPLGFPFQRSNTLLVALGRSENVAEQGKSRSRSIEEEGKVWEKPGRSGEAKKES